MLTCEEVCESVTEHLEGHPGFGERLAFRFHLLICKACRRFYRQFTAAVGVPAQLESAPGPTDAEIDALVEKLNER